MHKKGVFQNIKRLNCKKNSTYDFDRNWPICSRLNTYYINNRICLKFPFNLLYLTTIVIPSYTWASKWKFQPLLRDTSKQINKLNLDNTTNF